MFPSLCVAVGASQEVPPPEDTLTVVVDELESSGEFVLHHYASWAIRTGLRVVLLSFAQALGHYEGALKKLTVSVDAVTRSGHFKYVDGMGALLEEEEGEASAAQLFARLHLQETLHNATLLIVDDLSAAVSVGATPEQLMAFVQECRAALAATGRVVVLSHSDADDSECERLACLLAHSADHLVTVRGLTTGRSLDVHGQISVERRDEASHQSPYSAQFRIGDHSVVFFGA